MGFLLVLDKSATPPSCLPPPTCHAGQAGDGGKAGHGDAVRVASLWGRVVQAGSNPLPDTRSLWSAVLLLLMLLLWLEDGGSMLDHPSCCRSSWDPESRL